MERVRKQHPVVFDLLNVRYPGYPSFPFISILAICSHRSAKKSVAFLHPLLQGFTSRTSAGLLAYGPSGIKWDVQWAQCPARKRKAYCRATGWKSNWSCIPQNFHNMIQRLLLFNSFYGNLSQGFSPLQSQASDRRIAGSSNGCCWGCSRDGLGKSWAQVSCSTSRNE